MLTCKQFLQELSEFLDESVDPNLRSEIERHVNECPNCWVVCDTAKRTLKVFKGMEAQPLPPAIHQRLLAALQKRMAQKQGKAQASPIGH